MTNIDAMLAGVLGQQQLAEIRATPLYQELSKMPLDELKNNAPGLMTNFIGESIKGKNPLDLIKAVGQFFA